MNGGKTACPVLRSKAKSLHWDKLVESDAEFAELAAALREHFFIAKSEGMALKVTVQQGDKEDFNG